MVKDFENSKSEDGDMDSCFLLGSIFECEECFGKNTFLSVYYYEKSFKERGCVAAAHKLGLIYQRGQGVEKDFPKAIHYLTVSTEKGDKNSPFTLGLMYKRGIIVSSFFFFLLIWKKKKRS